MPLSERIISNPAESDANVSRVTRVFESTYQTVAAVAADPLFPQLGTPHPSFPNVKVDRHQFQVREDGTILLTVLYSNNGSGRISFNVKEDDEYFRWGYATVERNETIPTFTLAEKTINASGGFGLLKIWEPAPIELKLVNVALSATVVVPKLDILQVQQIIAQVGFLHEIPIGSGNKYAMMPPDISARDNEFDRIVYSWESDSGVPYPHNLPFQSPKKYVFPPPIQVGSNQTSYARPPFFSFVVIPGAPATSPGQTPPEPEYQYRTVNQSKLNGWVPLPGMDRA
jgi:hypothetical protein